MESWVSSFLYPFPAILTATLVAQSSSHRETWLGLLLALRASLCKLEKGVLFLTGELPIRVYTLAYRMESKFQLLFSLSIWPSAFLENIAHIRICA